ncbi:MAG: hypothetical protein Q4D62_08340 [Planctomycetia bacterium]|nr:hypothetical protein [Planctomycetia bacterium]
MRFTLLEHRQGTEKHWDLLLEWPGEERLRTWQFEEHPWESTLPGKRIGDHRRIYLDYEGPISHGRGEVRQCGTGTYRVVAETERGWQVALSNGRTCLLWLYDTPPPSSSGTIL